MNISGNQPPIQAQTNPGNAAPAEPRNPLSDDFINQVKALTKDNQFSREDYKTVLAGLMESGLPSQDIQAVRNLMNSLFNYTDKGFLDNGKLENSEMQVLRKQADNSHSRAAKQFFNAINDSTEHTQDTGLIAGMTRLMNSTGTGAEHYKNMIARREVANFEPAAIQLPEPKETPTSPAAGETEAPVTDAPGQTTQTPPADDQLSLENEQTYTYRENPVQPVVPFVDPARDEREEDESETPN